jgi:hypothetical protein
LVELNLLSNNAWIPDLGPLRPFVTELAISWRHAKTYPPGHPFVVSSAAKVPQLLGALLSEGEECTLGITRNALMTGSQLLDQQNPNYRDYAANLFSMGVATLTFQRNLTVRELDFFNQTISRPSSVIWENGGVARLLAAGGVIHILARDIDTDAFLITEEEEITPPVDGEESDPVGLWDRFVRALINGSRLSPEESLLRKIYGDPAGLALMVNEKFIACPAELRKGYLHAVALLAKQLQGEGFNLGVQALEKLAAFVNSLDPELRRSYLQAACSTSLRMDFAEEFLSRLSSGAILEALSDASAGNIYLPPLVMRILTRLAQNAPETAHLMGESEGLEEKLRVIFRRDELDKFAPEEYREALYRIVSTDSLQVSEQASIDALKKSLESHNQEAQIAATIFEILKSEPDPLHAQGLERNLKELCCYFLEIGDFPSLMNILDNFASESPGMEETVLLMRREILAGFADRDFMDKVLDGLMIWGKGKFGDIRTLIIKVGVPFVEPLLLRLAEAQEISLRRFYLECLREMGRPARDAAVGQLQDGRWFYVRNLLVLLRTLNDPEILNHVRRLMTHPHPKVRDEAIRTSLHFHDPAADIFLLKELNSNDRERQLNAVQFGETSRNPEVFKKLLALLHHTGLTDYGFTLKSAVVHTLGMIGNVEALPYLVKILESGSVLHPLVHNRLKTEIVRSLEHYPPQWVRPLLEKLAGSGRQEITRQAAETLKNLKVRGS